MDSIRVTKDSTITVDCGLQMINCISSGAGTAGETTIYKVGSGAGTSPSASERALRIKTPAGETKEVYVNISPGEIHIDLSDNMDEIYLVKK